MYARDLMVPPTTTRPDQPLADLARTLLDSDQDAVCVVDDDGALVGVVTGMDLVYREKRVHLPTTLVVWELVLQLGARRTERDLEKIAAARVDQLMTRDVVTAAPDTPLDLLATQMVEQHLSVLPIVEGGRLVGVVTRRAMVRTALEHVLGR
jgi:CBS domain-containing protein